MSRRLRDRCSNGTVVLFVQLEWGCGEVSVATGRPWWRADTEWVICAIRIVTGLSSNERHGAVSVIAAATEND